MARPANLYSSLLTFSLLTCPGQAPHRRPYGRNGANGFPGKLYLNSQLYTLITLFGRPCGNFSRSPPPSSLLPTP